MNERTSPNIASIARRILAHCKKIRKSKEHVWVMMWAQGEEVVNLHELEALAASCLTQAPDQPKRKRSK